MRGDALTGIPRAGGFAATSASGATGVMAQGWKKTMLGDGQDHVAADANASSKHGVGAAELPSSEAGGGDCGKQCEVPRWRGSLWQEEGGGGDEGSPRIYGGIPKYET